MFLHVEHRIFLEAVHPVFCAALGLKQQTRNFVIYQLFGNSCLFNSFSANPFTCAVGPHVHPLAELLPTASWGFVAGQNLRSCCLIGCSTAALSSQSDTGPESVCLRCRGEDCRSWCIGGERMQRGRGVAVRSPLGALVKLQVSAAGGNTACFLNCEP